MVRVKAYADTVPLADVGTRDKNYTTALFRMRDLFGKEAVEAVLPEMKARCTLPAKEKNKKAYRILNQPRKETP